MIVFSPDYTPMPDLATLESALGSVFPDADLRIPNVAGTGIGPHINVTPATDPPFSVNAYDNGSISTDGTLEQAAIVAALIRSLLPDGQRVIAVTPDGTRFVELTPGISSDDVANGWRDIADLNLD